MSGFYLIGVIAVWLWLTRLLWKGGRRLLGSEFANRGVRIALIGGVAAFWFGFAFWEVAGKKMYWDAKVRNLCERDGGIKVYETVELPAEAFDKYGNVPIPSEDKAGPQDPYFYRMESRTIREDDPGIIRSHVVIIRRCDGKVLGELVRYSRGGGDFPGPWHPSAYFCPPISKDYKGIEQRVFPKGGLNGHHE